MHEFRKSLQFDAPSAKCHCGLPKEVSVSPGTWDLNVDGNLILKQKCCQMLPITENNRPIAGVLLQASADWHVPPLLSWHG